MQSHVSQRFRVCTCSAANELEIKLIMLSPLLAHGIGFMHAKRNSQTSLYTMPVPGSGSKAKVRASVMLSGASDDVYTVKYSVK